MQRSWNRRWPKAQTVEEKHKVFLTVFILKSGTSKDYYGEMAERFNAAVLKTVVGASPPGVRISLSPPIKKEDAVPLFFSFKTESLICINALIKNSAIRFMICVKFLLQTDGRLS